MHHWVTQNSLFSVRDGERWEKDGVAHSCLLGVTMQYCLKMNIINLSPIRTAYSVQCVYSFEILECSFQERCVKTMAMQGLYKAPSRFTSLSLRPVKRPQKNTRMHTMMVCLILLQQSVVWGLPEPEVLCLAMVSIHSSPSRTYIIFLNSPTFLIFTV